MDVRAMRRISKIWMAAIAIALILGAGFLYRVLVGDSTTPHAQTPQELSHSQAEDLMVKNGLKELKETRAYPLRHLTAVPGEVKSMPVAMRRAVQETTAGTKLHLRFGRAQYVETEIGVNFWIVEGRGVTCIVRNRTAASICNTSVKARQSGLLLEVFRPGASPNLPPTHFIAIGVAPSWAREVSVKIGNASEIIRIHGHVYTARAERPIRIQELIR